MIENCYILYSCDGSFEPIVSNFSGLSAYSETFVSIDILDLGETPDTCFYVLSLGEMECSPTYNIDVNTGTTCVCQCYCYFIRSTTQSTDVTYVDCNNTIVVDTIQEGQTYNICSKVFPQFDTETQIPIKLTDICQDNQCPPTIPTVKPPNECDVITIFPMSVECLTLQPTNDKTFDGSTTLIITGGTPPYTIFWEVGSFAPALTNLGVGQYSATVTDYYGDFTANTTCVLTAETLTLSGMCFVVSGVSNLTTFYVYSESSGLRNGKPYYKIQYGVETVGYVFWNSELNYWSFCQTLECQNISNYNELMTTTFYPSGETGDWDYISDSPYYLLQSYVGPCQIPSIPKDITSLCVTLVVRSPKEGVATQSQQIQLDPSNDVNGQPSWSSSTGQYVIYWNTGSTPNQWTMTGYSSPYVSLINNDPTSPPLSNWQVQGSPEVFSMAVAQGECLTSYTISVSASVNDAACEQQGSITVSAVGGVAPYQYSIDGGASYQSSPIFNNLSPGIYSVFVKDTQTTVGSLTSIQVNNILPTTYTLLLNVNYGNGTFSITAPVLPNGVTISLNLTMTSTFSYYPSTLSPAPTYNNITTINGTTPMTLTNTTSSTVPLTGPCTTDIPVTVVQTSNTYTNTLTFTSGQVITGSTTSSIINNPTGFCRNAIGSYNLYMSSPVVNNCECCQVILNNPKLNPVPPIV
jgi:hypothetical protein